MADPGTAQTCLVGWLLPHPQRNAVLVRETEAGPGSGSWSLPTVRVDGAEPTLSQILDAIHSVPTTSGVVLRLIALPAGAGSSTRADESDEVSLVVEFDADAPEAPEGWGWRTLDPESIAEMTPEPSREVAASWAAERARGWAEQRPPWSRPGWFARASDWMLEQMAAHGRPATGVPRQHQLWGVSTVLRAPSADGDFYLKCSAGLFRHEAAMTRALAGSMQDVMPQVVSVEDDEGWLLMRGFDADEQGDQDQSEWTRGLVAHAGIQRSWLGRTDELVALGLPVRSLNELAAQVEEMAGDHALLSRLAPGLRERWMRETPTLAQSCLRLDRLGPGPSLVHGDFHPWNVVSTPDTVRVFDWTDATVSHPFVDLATYVLRADDVAVRRHLMDTYLACWSETLSTTSLQEAAELALVVGSVYQVQTYRSLLPTLMRDGADDGLAGGDVDWIKRTLSCYDHGLESPP